MSKAFRPSVLAPPSLTNYLCFWDLWDLWAAAFSFSFISLGLQPSFSLMASVSLPLGFRSLGPCNFVDDQN